MLNRGGVVSGSRRGRAAVGLATAVGACTAASACWSDPDPPRAYIHVLRVEQQPEGSDLGVIVAVQADGGNYVSLVAKGGTVRLLTSSDGGSGTTAACTPLGDGKTLTLLVTPNASEAILFANLYNLTSSSGGALDTLCQTAEPPVATSVTPVARPVNTPPIEDATPATSAVADASPDAAPDVPVDAGAADAPDGGT